MNQYTELLYYIKQLAEEDSFVNTVTQGEFDRLDLDKGNIFPLVHVQINNGNFTNGQVVRFNIQIGCFAVRDANNDVNNQTGIDKFWLQDNEVDNMNETLAVLNRMWLKMYTDFEENNIKASENPSIDPQYFTRTNLLDGWILTFDVEVPNTVISLCVEPTNLLSNGDFALGNTSWFENNVSAVYDNNATVTAGLVLGSFENTVAMVTEIGATYTITYNITAVEDNPVVDFRVFIGTTQGDSDVLSGNFQSIGVGSYQETFVATSTESYFSFDFDAPGLVENFVTFTDIVVV